MIIAGTIGENKLYIAGMTILSFNVVFTVLSTITSYNLFVIHLYFVVTGMVLSESNQSN